MTALASLTELFDYGLLASSSLIVGGGSAFFGIIWVYEGILSKWRSMACSLLLTCLRVLQFSGICEYELASRRYTCFEFVNKNRWFWSVRSRIATSRFCDFNIVQIWTLASRFNATTQVGSSIILVDLLLFVEWLLSPSSHVQFRFLEILLRIRSTHLITSIPLLQRSLRLIDLANSLNRSIYSSVELILFLFILASNNYLILNGHLQYYFDKTTISLVQMPKIYQLLVFLEERELPRVQRVDLSWVLIILSSEVLLKAFVALESLSLKGKALGAIVHVGWSDISHIIVLL